MDGGPVAPVRQPPWHRPSVRQGQGTADQSGIDERMMHPQIFAPYMSNWIVRIACDQINDRAVTRSILAPHAQADNLVGVKDKIEAVISADSNASIFKVNS